MPPTTKKAGKKAAKKTTKKATKKTPAATSALSASAPTTAAGASPCSKEVRGEEVLLNVFVQPGQRLEAFFQVCASPCYLLVSLFSHHTSNGAGTPLYDQPVPPSGEVKFDVGPLPSGRYTLHWGFAPSNVDWQIVAETWVGGVPRFRKLNASTDTHPFNNVFSIIEVL